MDDSTTGVTLISGFIFDVLNEYRSLEHSVCQPLFAMADDYDPKTPMRPAPMALYNDVCTWVEGRLGPASLRRAGRAIGKRVSAEVVKSGVIGLTPTPSAMLNELKRVASLLIKDPRGRGWEILEDQDTRILMRRTQTFNCILQEGLLLSLVEKTGVRMPQVEHKACTRKGAAFCEYEVRWHGGGRL